MNLSDEYRDIMFIKGFKYDGMVAIETIGDGSCLIHALLNGIHKPYREKMDGNEPIDRCKYVRNLRFTLSEILSKPRYHDKEIIWYDTLSNYSLRDMSKSVPDYSLEEMKRTLESSKYLDLRFHELLSEIFDKDIYFLDLENQDIYIIDNIDSYYKQRESVVLGYKKGHFELIGIRDKGTIYTHFKPNNKFILTLYSRLKELKKSKS